MKKVQSRAAVRFSVKAVLGGAAALACALALSGCAPRIVSIGFIGDLTGKQSELGVSGRNGALLAIEQADARPRFGRATFRLVTEDDRNSPEGFHAAVDDLSAAKIPAAIGPYTSAIAELASAEKRLLFVSPTASASSLAGRDDMMIRLMTTSSGGAEGLGREAATGFHAATAAVLYDADNELYAKDFIAFFRSAYEAAGGRVVAEQAYSSSDRSVQFAPILGKLLAARPAALLVIATGFDTALVIRRAKQMERGILTLTSGWAATTDFLRYGGSAMDGTLFEQQFDPDSRAPAYLDFVAAYRARFGSTPSFSSMYSYEAALILMRAMAKGEASPLRLKRRILAEPLVHGLQADYRLDAYGDVVRKNALFIVRGDGYRALP
ncbi:MAG TPA: ABC transporter substrate-binding protein [Rectinemataceae bacterium]|nr:ABC transporter substrate-binding protein [Rectinemataceae bacterium]